MESTEQDEGEGGLKKKVAAGVAVGLATTAAAGVAKKLLGSDDDGHVEGAENRARSTAGTAGEAAGKGASAAKSGSGAAAKQARSTGGSTRRTSKAAASTARSRSSRARKRAGQAGSSPTKEQLYAQAKRLKITGRSSMSKDQLQRAVQRAKR